jgi:hypothetical protein
MPYPTIGAQLDAMFPGAHQQFASPLMPPGVSRSPAATRQTFFEFLSEYETAIPLQALWAVIFKVPNKVTTETMNKWGEYLGSSAGYSVNNARKRLLHDAAPPAGNPMAGYPGKNGNNSILGCLFAQTVGIPVEQSQISTVGPNNRGFIKGPIMEQRQTFAPLNIEFLETNVSFNEFILRPWTIIAQHEGLIARNSNVKFWGLHDPAERITTDITVINFGKTPSGAGYGVIPRKMWLFEDCFPVNIGPETYSYHADTEPDRRDTEWNFRRYQVILPDHYLSTMDVIDKGPPAPAP